MSALGVEPRTTLRSDQLSYTDKWLLFRVVTNHYFKKQGGFGPLWISLLLSTQLFRVVTLILFTGYSAQLATPSFFQPHVSSILIYTYVPKNV